MHPHVNYDIYDSNNIDAFEQFVKQHRRRGSHGAVSDVCFYLPDADLARFFQDEDRLRRILYCVLHSCTNPPQRTSILERIKEGKYFKVFAILLLIHKGDAIKYFVQDPSLSDTKLPFDNPDKLPCQASDPDLSNAFLKKQWMFCIQKLRYSQFVKLSAHQILPYRIQKPAGSGISSNAFIIKVDPEYNELYTSREMVCENSVSAELSPDKIRRRQTLIRTHSS